jgi:hypothetical protein
MKLSITSPIIVLFGPPWIAEKRSPLARSVTAVVGLEPALSVPIEIGGKRAHRARFAAARSSARRARIAP